MMAKLIFCKVWPCRLRHHKMSQWPARDDEMDCAFAGRRHWKSLPLERLVVVVELLEALVF